MSLIAGLSTAKDLLDKLRRDAKLLEDEVTTDRFFNFVVTGWSLVDWVKNDPSVPPAAKTQVQSLKNDTWLRVCGDLGNASKHFTLTIRTPITDSANTHKGWGAGRWGRGGWGSGEEAICVTLNDGTSYSGLDLVKGVLQTWEQFFADHSM